MRTLTQPSPGVPGEGDSFGDRMLFRLRSRRSAASASIAAFSAGFAGLFGGELVSRSLFVSCPAAFAGDPSLLIRIHRGKAPSAGAHDKDAESGTVLLIWIKSRTVPLIPGASLQSVCQGKRGSCRMNVSIM